MAKRKSTRELRHPSGTAMMILDLTVLSFARIMELHIALRAQQKYDFAEEQTV